MERLPLNSKEYLIVNVTDRLKTLTSLDGVTLTYDVTDNEGTSVIDNQPASSSGMKAYCLIDTTSPTEWIPDEYELYLRISLPPENPILGPFAFKVG